MRQSFHGHEELVARLDEAVCSDCEETITGEVEQILTEMIQKGALALPDDLKQPDGDAYARRLLYQSEEHGYAVVAMIWGPNQGTALHDHDGVWCVEGVLEGTIEVTRYEPLERDAERWRFRPEKTITAKVGSSGSLIPPFEYHTIANGQQDAPSVTVHIYGHELQKAHIFEPETPGADWYRRTVRDLGYTH
ncbi:MAG: cysteine dioxygenase family protein [Acidobacteriota bacterium]